MFDSREFSDAHVLFLYNNQLIVGVSRSGELTAFGGRSESAESLMATIIREYCEESHEVIIPIASLVPAVMSAKARLVQKRRNGSFSFTAIIPITSFDFDGARKQFKVFLQMATSRSRQEVVDLARIDIAELKEAIKVKNRNISSGCIRYPTFQCLSMLF